MEKALDRWADYQDELYFYFEDFSGKCVSRSALDHTTDSESTIEPCHPWRAWRLGRRVMASKARH